MLKACKNFQPREKIKNLHKPLLNETLSSRAGLHSPLDPGNMTLCQVKADK